MKNILNSKEEKITDKAFKQSITISIIGILLCMVALCSVTWAWFSTEISSSSSDIKSAYCDVTVSVMNEGSKLDPIDGKYSFAKDKAYKIHITATGSAETAYCILKIDGELYYTAQIPTHTAMNFTLQFDAEVTDVEIITRWGISSVPAINQAFVNNGQYLNCGEVESLPKADCETNPNAEITTSQSNDTEPPVLETTTTELGNTETDTQETTVEITSSAASSEVNE